MTYGESENLPWLAVVACRRAMMRHRVGWDGWERVKRKPSRVDEVGEIGGLTGLRALPA